jgi:hypothetical protein
MESASTYLRISEEIKEAVGVSMPNLPSSGEQSFTKSHQMQLLSFFKVAVLSLLFDDD